MGHEHRASAARDVRLRRERLFSARHCSFEEKTLEVSVHDKRRVQLLCDASEADVALSKQRQRLLRLPDGNACAPSLVILEGSRTFKALQTRRAAVQIRARRPDKRIKATNPHKVTRRRAAVKTQQNNGFAGRAHAIVVLDCVIRVERVRHVEAEHVQRQVIHLRNSCSVLNARRK